MSHEQPPTQERKPSRRIRELQEKMFGSICIYTYDPATKQYYEEEKPLCELPPGFLVDRTITIDSMGAKLYDYQRAFTNDTGYQKYDLSFDARIVSVQRGGDDHDTLIHLASKPIRYSENRYTQPTLRVTKDDQWLILTADKQGEDRRWSFIERPILS